jgi:methyl-accepting chemotaxis protein
MEARNDRAAGFSRPDDNQGKEEEADRMTIKARLWALALGVLAGVLIMAGITYLRVDSAMDEQFDAAGRAAVDLSARNVDLYFQGLEKVVANAAGTIRMAYVQYGTTDEAGLEKIVSALMNGNKDMGIQDIYMGLESTGKFADGTGWQEPADYDCRKRSWYTDAVKAGKLIYTAPYVDAITKKTVLSIAVPIYDENRTLLGVVGGDINLDTLSQFVVQQKILGFGAGLLTNREGLVLVHSKPEWILKENVTKASGQVPEEAAQAGRKLVSGSAGYADYSLGGTSKRIYYAPIRSGFIMGINFPLDERDRIVQRLTMNLMLVSLTVLALVMLLVVSIAKGLSRSIARLFETAESVGSGDLTASFDDRGRDELALIAGALNGMLASLRETFRAVRGESLRALSKAESLAALSEESVASMGEVRSSIDRSAAQSEGNSAALEETNAGVEEVSAGASQAAKSATEGAAATAYATTLADSAAGDVGAIIRRIEAVGTRTRDNSDKIRDLAASVRGITEFVSTIGGIADQTNLLALNAAIEAARAGEAGRGFAVVAEEVRRLAEDSNGAAQRVGEIISGLGQKAEGAIRVTEETASEMTEAVSGARKAREGLDRAVGEIRKINDVMRNIASVSEEQAAASHEMAQAIDHATKGTVDVANSLESIREASRETTKAAEHVAEEAQEVADAAKTMQDLVGRFRTETGAGTVTPGGRR